jgi:hypothetical protein
VHIIKCGGVKCNAIWFQLAAFVIQSTGASVGRPATRDGTRFSAHWGRVYGRRSCWYGTELQSFVHLILTPF